MKCKYVCDYYGVPAEIGRRVIVNGRHGIIAEDCGHYIGVNFDDDKAGVISHCHPTWEATYGEMGSIRQLTAKQRKSKERGQRWREYGECFNSFMDFVYWHDDPDRSWNGGRN